MRKRGRFAGLLAGVLAIGVSLSAHDAGAQSFSPVAVVNDEVITSFDVDQRARLMTAAAGGSAVGRDQALEMLVEDTLRLQAAKRAGIDPTPDEVRLGFNEISELNQRDPAKVMQFFQSQGITDDAITSQIKAEVAWRQLIRQRYAPRVRVSEAEVEQAMATMGSTTARYRLAQLVIALQPGAPQGQAKQAFDQATQLRSQLTSCADIEARKAQYHPISGDVGNLSLAEMPTAVRDAVSGLEVGQTTAPVRSNDGVHVIMVCGKQGGEAAGSLEARQRAVAALQSSKLERYSRSLLRELRREAVIDKR